MALTKITPQMFDTSAAGHDFNIDNGTFVVDASANRVGIGTASPSLKFHSSETGGSTIAGLFQTNQTDSYISFQASGTTDNSTVRIGAVGDDLRAFVNGAFRFAITSAGNVGVGNGLIAPSTEFHVKGVGTVATFEGTGGTSFISIKDSDDSTQAFIGVDAGVLKFQTSGSSYSDKLIINTSGQVGIKEGSPGYRLVVREDVAASSDLDPVILHLRNGSDGGAGILFSNSVNGQSKISFGVEGTGASTDETFLGFSTGENGGLSERIRIDSSGRVGIGAVTGGSGNAALTGNLHVHNGTAGIQFVTSSNSALRLVSSGGENFIQSGTAVSSSSAAPLIFSNVGGSGETMRIDSSGNVGINDTNPDRKVSIIGDSTSGGQYPLSLDATNTDYIMEFRRSGTSEWWFKASASNFTVHENGVGDHFRISAGGDIGIGTDGIANSGGNRLSIDSATNAAPVTSGTTQTGGALRLRGGDNAVLDFGLNSVNTWIQATDKVNLANKYNISLNPNGGNVGIGTLSPSEELHVNSALSGQHARVHISKTSTAGTAGVSMRSQAASNTWTMYQEDASYSKLFFYDGAANVLTLDSANNVAVAPNFLAARTFTQSNGSAPAYALTIQADNGGNAIEVYRTASSRMTQYMSADGKYYFDMYGSATPEIRFRNAGTDWMRTQGSRLYIGSTTQTLNAGTGASGTGSNQTLLQVNGAVDMGYQGRFSVCIWGPTVLASNGRYTHLRTSMWGGGSPHGNTEYIMGGFLITGYRYQGTANHRALHQFHNWVGTLYNYTVSNLIDGGGWTGASHVYVDSTGYVTIRLDSQSSNYRMFMVDYVNYSIYNKVDSSITAITVSNATTV